MARLAQFYRQENRNKKAQMILDWHRQSTDERQDWLQLRNYYWNLYSGRTTRSNIPWEGASDIHVPLVAKLVEAMVPRYIQAIFGQDPIAHVLPVEKHDIDDSDDQEKWFNWALEAQVQEFFKKMNSWFRLCLIDGTSICKTWYAKDWRKVRQKYRMSRLLMPGDSLAGARNDSSEPIELEDTDFIDHLLKVKGRIKAKGDHVYTCEVREGEKWVDAEIEIVYPEDEDTEYVDILASHEQLVYDAPKVEPLNIEDVYLPFRATDLQTCRYVIHEIWLTLDELAARRDEGIYHITDKEWQEIVKAKDTGLQETSDDSPRQEEIDTEQGINRAFIQDDKYGVLETYCFDDIDDDYRDEHMLYSVLGATGRLIRWQYVEEEFPHGHRPFADIHYIPVPGRFYSKGIAEVVAPLQLEINTIFNQVNDRENLINNPFFFYTPAAGSNPNQYLRVRPGEGIPVEDPARINFPNWGKAPLSGIEMSQMITQFAEELIGLGPSQMGQRRSGSAPRTARGTGMILAEGNVKVDSHIKLIQQGGFKELLYQIFTLYQEFAPEEIFFRITGERKSRRITRKSLKGRYDFILTGNTDNTNREVQQQRSLMMYQTLAAEPLYMQDLGARRELVMMLLRNYDDGNIDRDKLMPQVPVPLRARTPDEIISLLAQGIRVEPRPGEDPNQVIAALDAFSKSPEFEAVDPQHVPLFSEAREVYALMLQLQEQMMGMKSRNPKTGIQPAMTGAAQGGGGMNPGMPSMPQEMMPEAVR